MAMEHDIGREPLALLLKQIYLEKLSGQLAVRCREFQITLYFQAGELINGMSTRFDEKISVILHLMGMINEEQYNFLSGLHQFPDDQVGEILIDHHFAKRKDLFLARIHQLRRIAISIFSLKAGKWNFTPDAAHPPFQETFVIPLAGILVEGARSIDQISFYANRWLLRNPLPAKEIPLQIEVYLTDPELAFYAQLSAFSPQMTCQEIIARLDILPIDFWRRILVFHLSGLLPFEKNNRGTDIGRDISDLLVFHQQIQFTPGNVFALLGLAPDAPAGVLENARKEFLRRYSPERFGSAAAPEIKNIARAVCQWLQKIAAAQGEAESPVEAELLSETELVVEYESPAKPELLREAEIVIEPEAQAEPELLREVELIREPEIPACLNVAPEWDVEFELPTEAEPGLADEPPAGEFVPAAAPPALHLASGTHEKAWDFLLKSKEMYERREFYKAVDLLKIAIKLEPGQGDFYYLLGLCQGEIEGMKHEAEINLKKAIELKSWSADPVYALGVLYRGMGKTKLAERCFQRVKEIAYEHTGASRALVDLRRQQHGKKDKVSFLKKKIF